MHILKGVGVLLLFTGLTACNQRNPKQNDDTINSGLLYVTVDETLKPLMEAEFTVFSYQHIKAHLIASYKPEREAIEDFKGDSTKAVILARELTVQEMDYFKSIQYVPRSMPFAKDGIALIVNRENKRDSFTVQELKKMLTGQTNWKELGYNNGGEVLVVFDNVTSSTVRWIKDSMMGKENFSAHCFAVNSNPEVINYVKTHHNAIGIIGNAWLSDLDDSNVVNFMKVIKRAKIALSDTNEYLEPFQSEIETRRYPLARMVYCIQRDGKVGLGTGLQRFLYDERGQLIVLKFGLMPFKQPERSIEFKQ